MATNLRTGLRQSIKSSLETGLVGGDIFGTSKLDLRFAQQKTLDPRVTHTRASSATFVDSSGVLRSAVTNLLLRSEEFDDASWSKANVTVQENAALAPNGSTLADKLIASATTAIHNISQTVTASSAAHTFSIYLKAAELTTVSIRSGRSGNFVNADINLSLGTIASPTTGGTATNGSSSIQRVSNDWYRCSVTGSNLGDGQIADAIYIPDDASLPGDGTSGIYIWGAQLEQSSTVGDYVPTTSTINSAPRFDHDPTTGESLGLLVEEARTNLSLQSEDFSNAYWVKTSCTITSNESTAPNGTLTADLWTNTGSPGVIENSITKDTTARTYTSSLWVKGTLTQLTVSLDDGTTVNRGRVQYNLSTNVVGTVFNDGLFTNTSGTLTRFPGGWVRVTMTTTTSSGITIRLRPFFSGTGSTARIWGAQVEEGAFPTSYIPTVASTVTRAADVASITGSNFGVTRTNLLVRSEEFDNAAWTKTRSSVTANAITAPNGTLTADQLVEDTTVTNTHNIGQSISFTSGTTYTVSVFAKATASPRFLQIIFPSGAFTATRRPVFDLLNGIASAATDTTASIQNIGDGWYRCIASMLATNTNSASIQLQLANTYINSAPTYTGDGTSGIYIWGAQLEVGSAVTPYIQSPSVFTSRASSGTYVGGNGLIQTATTNEARYDHDPVSLISKGLLLEEARTNLLTYSEELDTGWINSSGATWQYSSGVSPAGTTTALGVDGLSGTVILSNYSSLYKANVTISGSTAYTFSVYVRAKTDTISNLVLRLSETSGNNTISSAFTVTTSWQRISLSVTTAVGATAMVCLVGTNTGTADVFIWGAQLEVGAFPTSYIPTTTATVTRAADISTSVATSVFESSWYNQTEGTVFAEASGVNNVTGATRRYLELRDAGASDRLILGYQNTTNNRFLVVDGGATVANINVVSLPTAKAAGAYKVNSFQLASNGALGTEDNVGVVPTPDRIQIGSQDGSSVNTFLNGTIKRITYWPTRLANPTLQSITTP
jgi:hypothetical protein